MEGLRDVRHGDEAVAEALLGKGVSKAELARRFQLSRRTIQYWIESGQLDRELAAGAAGYVRRAPIAHKLDAYKGIIEARLQEYPKLTAQRLYEEVLAAGYAGGYSRVRDYVRQVRPREVADPVVRFETPAGRQGQVDFGSFSLPWGWRHALLVVLGWGGCVGLQLHLNRRLPNPAAAR